MPSMPPPPPPEVPMSKPAEIDLDARCAEVRSVLARLKKGPKPESRMFRVQARSKLRQAYSPEDLEGED